MNKTRSGRSRKLIEREEKIIIGEVKKILYLYIFKYDVENVWQRHSSPIMSMSLNEIIIFMVKY